MTSPAYIHQENFRRILTRNITLPLCVGALNAAVFVGLIFYLLSALSWTERAERVIGNANEIAKLSADMETNMRGYLITGEESYLQPYETAKSRMASEIAVQTERVQDNPSQTGRLKRMGALQAQWNEYAQSVIDLRRKNLNYQQEVRSGKGKSITDEVRRELSDFVSIEERMLQQRDEKAKSTTFWSMAAYLLFSLGLNGLLALVGRRELMLLSKTYGEALQLQTNHGQLLQEQSWLRTGQRQLAEHTIGQHALESLGSNVLEFLARYLEVAVAALYVREDNGSLRRVAAYGFSKEGEQTGGSYYRAEGLVGQAAAENRVLQLDDLPENYLKVTSGLGHGSPRHVLVVPVHNDGQVNGVVELGFLRALGPRDTEFVTMIANNIGNSIHAALYRLRLQDVLAESQELNEKLQSQQEELRTANEELEEKSRVLKEYQGNLETQQSKLEQTNGQLSELALSLDQKNVALNQAQILLEERARELTRASRYKSEFLANMSHELRTPLNSSLILAKLLSDNPQGNLAPEQVKFAQSIYSAGNDLLNLINDILDISKVEAGKLELTPEKIVIGKLIDSLKSTFEPLADQKKLTLNVDLKPGTLTTLVSDRQRVEQILKNLLSNAIKFTEVGNVSLTVSERTGGYIAFVVRDSGVGIDTDQQQSIFEAFRQADGTTSRRYGGTGLGLSISRDLTTLLGGFLTVESSKNEGSTFTLLLPCIWSPLQTNGMQAATVQPAQADHTVPSGERKLAASAGMAMSQVAQMDVPVLSQEVNCMPLVEDDALQRTSVTHLIANNDLDQSLEGRKVLLVDDDMRNIFALTSALEQKGMLVEIGRNGFEAIEKLENISDIDLVLMDVMMPGMDGLEATRRIRQDPRFQKLPIIAVTAKAMRDDQEQCLKAGTNDYLAKPIDLDCLFSLLRVWMPSLERV